MHETKNNCSIGAVHAYWLNETETGPDRLSAVQVIATWAAFQMGVIDKIAATGGGIGGLGCPRWSQAFRTWVQNLDSGQVIDRQRFLLDSSARDTVQETRRFARMVNQTCPQKLVVISNESHEPRIRDIIYPREFRGTNGTSVEFRSAQQILRLADDVGLNFPNRFQDSDGFQARNYADLLSELAEIPEQVALRNQEARFYPLSKNRAIYELMKIIPVVCPYKCAVQRWVQYRGSSRQVAGRFSLTLNQRTTKEVDFSL